MLGANYRMTEWQCAVLIAQLERMPNQIEHKRAMAERLGARLAKVRGLIPLAPDPRVTRQVIYAFLFRVQPADARRLAQPLSARAAKGRNPVRRGQRAGVSVAAFPA